MMEALAGLDPSQLAQLEGLSPQDRKILPALALRATGATWKEAALSVGMSVPNLIQHAQRRGWYSKAHAAKRDTLAGLAIDTASSATRRIGDFLEREPDEGGYGRNELVTVAGVMADKAVNLRRVELQAQQGTHHGADSVAAVLGRLASSGGGTLTVRAEPDRVLDVTPTEGDDA